MTPVFNAYHGIESFMLFALESLDEIHARFSMVQGPLIDGVRLAGLKLSPAALAIVVLRLAYLLVDV